MGMAGEVSSHDVGRDMSRYRKFCSLWTQYMPGSNQLSAGWKCRILVLVAVLGTLLNVGSASGQDEPGAPPLNVILLMDSSGSMYASDPERLRIPAAEFLFSYLKANATTPQLAFRFGAASFTDEIIDEESLFLVSGIEIEDFFVRAAAASSAGENTDFLPALAYAGREIGNVQRGIDARSVVIILTDGKPEGLISDSEIMQYFSRVGEHVELLASQGAELFVIGIGGARDDRDQWETVLEQDHFISLTNTSNLGEMYRTILADFMELEVADAQLLEEGASYAIEVEPHLEQVNISVIKDLPDGVITLSDPNGRTHVPSDESDDAIEGAVSADRRHDIYVIREPQAGTWIVRVEGTTARVLVDRRLPHVLLELPLHPIGEGRKFSITAHVLSDSLLSLLTLDGSEFRLAAAGPDGAEIVMPLVYILDERYFAEFEDGAAAGEYTFRPELLVEGETIPLQSNAVSLTVYPAPVITDVTIDGGGPMSLLVDSSIQLDVMVEHANRLVEGVGAPEVMVTFQDDLQVLSAPLAEIAPGHYQLLFKLSEPGNYEVEVALKGDSLDNVSYSEVERLNVSLELPAPPPTVTPAPSPIPTPTPTLEPVVAPPLDEPEVDNQVDDNGGGLSPWLPVAATVIILGGLLLAYARWTGRKDHNRKPEPTASTQSSEIEKALQEAERFRIDGNNLRFKSALEKTFSYATSEALFDEARSIDSNSRAFKLALESMDLPEAHALATRNVKHTRYLYRGLMDQLSKKWKEQGGDEFLYLYKEVFANGLPMLEILQAVEESDNTTLSGFARAVNRLLAPSTETTSVSVAEEIDRVLNERIITGDSDTSTPRSIGDGLASIHHFIEKLPERPPIYPDSVLENAHKSTLTDVMEYGPEILANFLQELGNFSAIIISRPKSVEGWENVEISISALIDKTLLGKYAQLPEACLLRNRFTMWRRYAQQMKDELQRSLAQAGEPGTLLFEFYPSLNTNEREERYGADKEWHVTVPGIIYHGGGAPISIISISHSTDGSPKPLSIAKDCENLQWGQSLTVRVEPTLSGQSDFMLNTSFFPNSVKNDSNPKVEEKLLGRCTLAPEIINRNSNSEQWFIHGKPLDDDEQLRRTVDELNDQRKRIVGRLFEPRVATELFSIRGLRQTGKTTLLKAVERDLRNHNSRPDSLRKYICIYIDLMEWMPKSEQRDSLRFRFWLKFAKELKAALSEFEHLNEYVPQIEALIADFRWSKLRDKAKSLSSEVGIQIVYFIDEADKLDEFGDDQEGLFDEIVRLCRDTDAILFIAHDNRKRKSIQTLLNYYKRVNKSAEIVNRDFMTQKQLFKFLGESPLPLTDLARHAMWGLTGGHVSLVQLLGKGLTERLEEQQADPPIVTVNDVKHVAEKYGRVYPAWFEYFENGFEPDELLVLTLLIHHFIDARNGLAAPLTFNSDNRWDNTEDLLHLARIYMPVESEEQLQDILKRLREKQMIEPVEVMGKQLELVRLRPGWFYTYFSLQPMFTIKGPQPAIAI